MSHSQELSNTLRQDATPLREIRWDGPKEEVKKQFSKACHWLPVEIALNLAELEYERLAEERRANLQAKTKTKEESKEEEEEKKNQSEPHLTISTHKNEPEPDTDLEYDEVTREMNRLVMEHLTGSKVVGVHSVTSPTLSTTASSTSTSSEEVIEVSLPCL